MMLLVAILILAPSLALFWPIDSNVRKQIISKKIKNYHGLTGGLRNYGLFIGLVCLTVLFSSQHIFKIYFIDYTTERYQNKTLLIFAVATITLMIIHTELLKKVFSKNKLPKAPLGGLLFINMLTILALLSHKFNISNEMLPLAFSFSFFCFMFFPLMIVYTLNTLEHPDSVSVPDKKKR